MSWKETLSSPLSLLAGDKTADLVVPPSGATAWLTILSSAIMGFLAVFAIAFWFATDRLADRWDQELSQTATIRIAAEDGDVGARVEAVETILRETDGIEMYRSLSDEEQRLLLEPWFGPDLPVSELNLPRLIELVAGNPGYDGAALTTRLANEVPEAIFDDHTTWRAPLSKAAARLRMMGILALALIAVGMGAMITLAAKASLAANSQVVELLRLIGAQDSFVARAFVRRITLRALAGSAIGVVLGIAVTAVLPSSDVPGAYLSNLGFQGLQWLWLVLLPIFAAIVAFFATRLVALRIVRKVM